MRVWIAIAAAALIGAAVPNGCALRDRSNPLDPRNRSTHGMLTGFNALAGDQAVVLRWTAVVQEGLLGYRIDRWMPGATPQPLPNGSYSPFATSAEDLSVSNDSTYVYRLVARFASGDSAASPPDTVTPGTRRLMVLVSSLPGVVGLSPDVRDILYADLASEPYDDLELDSTRGVFWLSQYDRGLITSRRFETISTGIEFEVAHPTDIAVTTARGFVWAAQPELHRVSRLGTIDTVRAITGVGPARAVATNNANATLWIGSDDGRLFHASAATAETLQSWVFDGRVNPVGVDEGADAAWIAVRSSERFDLYRVLAGNPDPALIRSGLLNVTDIEVEPVTHSAWVCERGAPLAGSGRITRFGASGEVLAVVTGLEPYALSIEPGSASCWVTDIKSDRLLEVSPSGAILRRSPPLGVPYGVRVYRP